MAEGLALEALSEAIWSVSVDSVFCHQVVKPLVRQLYYLRLVVDEDFDGFCRLAVRSPLQSGPGRRSKTLFPEFFENFLWAYVVFNILKNYRFPSLSTRRHLRRNRTFSV